MISKHSRHGQESSGSSTSDVFLAAKCQISLFSGILGAQTLQQLYSCTREIVHEIQHTHFTMSSIVGNYAFHLQILHHHPKILPFMPEENMNSRLLFKVSHWAPSAAPTQAMVVKYVLPSDAVGHGCFLRTF